MFVSVKTLLSAIVDYAGLFPPAKLDLATEIAHYQQYQREPNHWMLGRFVLPLSQLTQFTAIFNGTSYLPPSPFPLPPSLSVTLDGDLDTAIAQLQTLRSPDNHEPITITAVELPRLSPTDLQRMLPYLPEGIEVFCEIPCSGDIAAYLTALKKNQANAKVRTGGITPQAFPSPSQLSQFMLACAQTQVPFKATAGLHHPLPARYPITADSKSPAAAMHGFLNVAIAAALAYLQRITAAETLALLQEAACDSFQFTETTICWRDRCLNLPEIQFVRNRFFRSFGSCSFQDPVHDLNVLALLG